MNNSLKIFFALCVFFIISPFTLVAADTKLCFTQFSIGTSAVVYGDEIVKAQNELIKQKGNPFRFVFSTDVSLGLMLDPQVRILTGGTLATDFCFHGDYYANRLDYGFFTGVRIYTGLAGLVAGVDYVCGRRSDYLMLPDDSGAKTFRTSWGNGFRFIAEYDFSNGQADYGLAPIVTMSWRRMPRGGYYDHNYSVCFKIGL
ncbi:MAG TPA: hypothetical protein VFC68_05820 [Treponemataceae bacterium]|nr:hypothetical protein [Treponemataceae bacterium]